MLEMFVVVVVVTLPCGERIVVVVAVDIAQHFGHGDYDYYNYEYY